MAAFKGFRDKFGPYMPLEGAEIATFLAETYTDVEVVKACLTDLESDLDRLSYRRYLQHYRCPDLIMDESGDAILTQTLTALGARVLRVDAGSGGDSRWRHIERALDWSDDGEPLLIMDESGDASLLIDEGVKAEDVYAKTGQLPDPSSAVDPELQTVFHIIRDGLETHPMRFHNMKKRIVGLTVGTTSAVDKLYQMQADGSLSFPAFNINDSATMSKYINLFGSRYVLLDGIKRSTDMNIYGKKAVVCGFGDDASEGCAMALRHAGANVVVYEVNTDHATQALLRDFSVIKTLDYVVPEADLFVINKGNIDYVLKHVKKMKRNTIIYITNPIFDRDNRSTYCHNQYFSAAGMKHIIVDCQTEKWVNSDTNSCVIVLSNTGYPDLMSSWSRTCHLVGLIEFWIQKGTGKYVGKVYDLPEHLEEKVSDLHLGELRAAATEVTAKEETIASADIVSVENNENLFTVGTGGMNVWKIFSMLIHAFPLIGLLVYALNKATKAELSFSAFWGTN